MPMNRQEKIQINNIPAILYGSASDRLYLYVHGKHSSKEEAERFANIATKSGYQVLSFDLPEHGERANEQYPCTAQNGVHDLNAIYSFIKNKYNSISLYACSLGAYFSLVAYQNTRFDKCLFLSPILDMERLIQNMMKWSNIYEYNIGSMKVLEKVGFEKEAIIKSSIMKEGKIFDEHLYSIRKQ
jgi:esterase/lipase